jgi:uncharacterized protein YjbI with pentapeptide repeats
MLYLGPQYHVKFGSHTDGYTLCGTTISIVLWCSCTNAANATAANATAANATAANATAANATAANATAANATAANATAANATNKLPSSMKATPVFEQVVQNGYITIDLPFINKEPEGANWTYVLESLPQHGSIQPIKKGDPIPNGN